MVRNPRPLLLSLAIAGLIGWMSSANGATFVVPSDETLIDHAEMIVTGTIDGSTARFTEDGSIETVYRLKIEDTLKGDAVGVVELREWGGILDGQWMVASGAPHYETGQRYLLFLSRFRDGSLTTHELALGQFKFLEIDDEILLVRHLGDSAILGQGARASRNAVQFLSMIRERVATTTAAKTGVPGVSVRANDLDTKGAAGKGAAQWSSGSSVSYTISSSPATGNTRGNDAPGAPEERIIIDDPNGDIPGTFSGSGTIATAFFGGTTGGFTDRINLTYSDIVVQDGVGSATGVSQEQYATVLTHELGHTLGFRHSNQNRFSDSGSACDAPLPCSSTAVMNSFILSGLNGVLQAWDKSALTSNYGSSPDGDYLIVDNSSLRPWYRTNTNVAWRISGGSGACGGPVITSGPVANPSAIELGKTVQLSVSATASAGSLQFQWYRGSRGNTSNPVPGGTVSAIAVSPSQTTTYWVRITDGCGTVDSAAVQVVVAVCEPVIISAPMGKVIGPGESTTLVVTAANATSYTWYQGEKGNTSQVAGTGSVLTVSPAQNSSYWVRVANSCGFVDSNAVTVQVLQCPPPVILQHPSDVELQSGEKATLQVVAGGSEELRYEWYRGMSGDTSSPIPESSSVLVLENVTSEYDVWVRVYGDCGYRDSRSARIRLVTICTPPGIEFEPDDPSVFSGERALLQIHAKGSSLIYQWFYRPGAFTVEVRGATGPTHVTDPLFQGRTYFVRVRNNCGAVQSRDAIVTVRECTAPNIISLTADQELSLGDTVELEVVPEGTGPFEIQWYEGSTGDVSMPVEGGRESTIDVGPLSGTVKYWVRVTNPCGTIDSDTIELRVTPVRARPSRHR